MPTPILQHPAVFDALPDIESVRTRFFHVRQRLHVFGAYPRSKSTRGHNRGWMRIPVGGTGGNQYQLWWRPSSNADGERQIVLGTIRHHDDHDYLPDPSPDELTPVRLDLDRPAPLDETPWTASQRDFL